MSPFWYQLSGISFARLIAPVVTITSIILSFNKIQNVSILDFIEAKDDGHDGDNWSYKKCKAPV